MEIRHAPLPARRTDNIRQCFSGCSSNTTDDAANHLSRTRNFLRVSQALPQRYCARGWRLIGRCGAVSAPRAPHTQLTGIAWRENHDPTIVAPGDSVQFSGDNIRCDANSFSETGDIIATILAGTSSGNMTPVNFEIASVNNLEWFFEHGLFGDCIWSVIEGQLFAQPQRNRVLSARSTDTIWMMATI